jgi:hypothetical protein
MELKPMNNLRVYRFQTKVRKDSSNEMLTNFLKEKDGELTEKEKVWWAVSAFWLPIALKESSDYSQQEIARYGLAAIQRLQEQIAHLSLVLNLDIPQASSTPASNYTTAEFNAVSPSNGGTNQLQARREGEVKAYTEVDGLDTKDTCLDDEVFDEKDLVQLEKMALSADNSHFDKVFGIE